MKKKWLLWLDDVLLHAKTIPELLQAIEMLFGMCAEQNIKLHPAKCILFAKSIRWYGRLISSEGIRYDPRRMEGLLSMEPPQTGANLQQFVCALQWVKNGIPEFSRLVAPLHEFLERVYTFAGKRTKKAVTRVKLQSLGWSEIEHDAFANASRL